VVEDHLEPEWLQTIRMIPSWYMRYFYYPEIVLEEDRLERHTKGVSDMQAEEELHRIYSEAGYTAEAQQILANKGGAQYYLPVLQAAESITHDRGDVIIMDTFNQGAITDLPQKVCVEVPNRVYRDRVEPLPIGPLPLSVRALVQTVKDMGVNHRGGGQRRLPCGHQRMVTNPLVGTYPKAQGFPRRVIENEMEFITPLK